MHPASRTTRRFTRAICAASIAAFCSAHAADFTSTWTGGTDLWSAVANWDTPGAPGTFPNNGLSTYDAVLSNGGTIVLDQNITIQKFTLSSGSLAGGFNLILNEGLTWTAGTMSGTGATTVAGAGSTISGSGQKGLDRVLTNTGTITFSTEDNTTPFYFGLNSGVNPGVLNNQGTFNVTAGGDFSQNNGNADHAINNSATWNVSGDGTTSSVNGIAFNNTGTVNVLSGAFVLGGGADATVTGDFNVSNGGTLNFNSSFDFGAASDIAGAGAVVFSGGTIEVGGTYNVTGSSSFTGATVNFNAPITSLGSGPLVITTGAVNFNSNNQITSGIDLSGGTLGGTSTIAATGNLTWTGGTMSGTGATTVAGAGSTISGSGQKGLDRVLTNTGTITFSTEDNTTPFYFGLNSGVNPGVLNNQGTFNVTAGGDFSQNNGNADHAINNSATWNVSGDGTTSSVNGIAFNNTGTVNVLSGAFVLGGGADATVTGDFNVSNGGTLNFNSSFDFGAASDIAGAGAVVFSGGTIEVGGTYNVTGSSSFTGATVNFNAPITSLGSGPLVITTGAVNFNSNNQITSGIDLSGGTLGGTSTIAATGNLTWTGGTMSGTGATTVAGAGSTISGSGQKGLDRVLTNTGTITFSTEDNTTPFYFGLNSGVNPGVLNNQGTFNVTAGGDFSQNNGNADHAINNSATWNVSGDGTTSSVNGIAFNNTGTVNVLSGAFVLGGGADATVTGDFNVSNGGTLNFNSSFDFGAASDIAGAGAVVFSGGTIEVGGTYNVTGSSSFTGATVNFNAPITSLGSGPLVITTGAVNFNSNNQITSGIDLSGGTLGGTSTIAATGNLSWTAGTMSGTGTTTVGGAASTISGTGTKSLERTLTNTGTITFDTPDQTTPFYFGLNGAVNPAVLNNQGTFNVTAGGDFQQNFFSPDHAINNSGIWNVSGDGTTSSVNGIAFNNTGTVNVNSGTFVLAGGDDGNTTGAFNVPASATLNFSSGAFSLNAGSAVTGAGTVQFGGASWSFNAGTYNVTGTTLISSGVAYFHATASTTLLDLSNGTLGGSGTLNAGNLTWTAGTMEGTGTTTVGGAASTISGTGTKSLERTLTNTGTITFDTPDQTTPFYFGLNSAVNPAVLNNQGTFNVTAGGDFQQNFFSPDHAINNSGTWNVSGADTTSSVNGIAFNNTGTVNVNSGTFVLAGGDDGNTTGAFNVPASATLNFSSGAFSLNAGSAVTGAGTVQFGGATWSFNAGTYNVTGTTLINGGTASFNATASTTLLELSGGSLGGSGPLNAGNLTWTAGTMEGTGTTTVGGAASTISGTGTKSLERTLTNTGTITFDTPDQTTPFYFGLNGAVNPAVLNNQGTFNVTAGGDFQQNFFSPDHAINNSGIWNVSGADTTSSVNGIAFNNTGTLNVNSGAFSLTGATVTQYASDILTAGVWRVFADSVLSLPTTGTGVVTNQADVTLSGAGSVLQAGGSNATLDSTLTTNSGALRILANRDYTATSAFVNTGVLQLGGGTFAAPGLTNTATGEIFGFGTVSIRPTNSGLIRSAGGTLAFANGIQGGSGTVQIDAGSTLDLSAGASNSSTDFLTHNGTTLGSLNLGANNFTVGVDYTNASFGSGNTFNPRANVSGSGQILAAGNVAQALAGDVTNGATATPALVSFGNVHVGDSVTRNYQIANTGTTGASLRGAIQTSVNGGNVTDARLGGAGVTAGNFGPIAPGTATTNLAVTFNATSAGALTGQAVRIANNFDNVGEQTLSIAGAAYRFASPSAHTPEPVNFGNLHVGDPFPVQALTLANTATNDGFSESLDVAFAAFTGGVTGTGAISLLGPGATDSATLKVGFSTATAGDKSGTARLAFTSNGSGSSGLGTTSLPFGAVAVSGAVFRLADPARPAQVTFSNRHVGDVVSSFFPIQNLALSDGFSEALDAAVTTTTGSVTATGSLTALPAGSTSTTAVSIGLNSTTAGAKSGTFTVGFASNGGPNGLGLTTLAPHTVAVSGAIFRFASAEVVPAGPVNFGIVHVGDTVSQTLAVTNTATSDGFSEQLSGSISGQTDAANGAGSFNQLAPSANSTALSVSIDTLTAGVKSGTVTLGFVSDGLGTSGLGTTALASQTINISAQVNNFAAPIYLFGSGAGALSGGGTSYTLDFGTIVLDEPFRQATLSLGNGAAAPADSLAGSFMLTPGSFEFSNFSNFTGLLAGQSLSTLTVGFTPDALGGFTGTIILDPRSQNTSGFDGGLSLVTLNIKAIVVPEPSAALLLGLGSLLIGLQRRRP